MKYALLSLFFLLSACHYSPPPSAEELALFHRVADQPVTCYTQAECQKKWARAVEWIKSNEHVYCDTTYEPFEIRTFTDSMIQTSGYTIAETQEFIPGYQVIKYRLEKGGYKMDFSTLCDHFACSPSGLGLRMSFVAYVQGPPPGVKCDSHGCYAKKKSVQ